MADFTPDQLARAKEALKADEALYSGLLAQGLTAAQVEAEMAQRGHSARYVALLARRIGKPTVDINNPGPAAPRNQDPSSAPSHDLPMRGSDNAEKKARGEDADSMDQGDKPDIDDVAWMMGHDYTPVLDEHTGLAKWPLSFKRVNRDVNRGKRGYKGQPASPQSVEMPPRAV